MKLKCFLSKRLKLKLKKLGQGIIKSQVHMVKPKLKSHKFRLSNILKSSVTGILFTLKSLTRIKRPCLPCMIRRNCLWCFRKTTSLIGDQQWVMLIHIYSIISKEVLKLTNSKVRFRCITKKILSKTSSKNSEKLLVGNISWGLILIYSQMNKRSFRSKWYPILRLRCQNFFMI